jgi:crossover junction endodeoxyribonuclease RusA
MKINIAWPPMELSPNARCHYMAKHRATISYKTEAMHLTLMELKHGDAKKFVKSKEKLSFSLKFFRPTDRRRYDDNLVAMMKPARDGIVAALFIDDSQIVIEQAMISEKSSGFGYVTIEITEAKCTQSC